jgi:hypothetical protein
MRPATFGALRRLAERGMTDQCEVTRNSAMVHAGACSLRRRPAEPTAAPDPFHRYEAELPFSAAGVAVGDTFKLTATQDPALGGVPDLWVTGIPGDAYGTGRMLTLADVVIDPAWLTDPVTVVSYEEDDDDEGNVVETETGREGYQGRIEQTDAVEITVGRQVLTSTVTLYLPPDAVISADDRVEAQGLEFDVVGRPQVVTTPHGPHHIAANLVAVDS